MLNENEEVFFFVGLLSYEILILTNDFAHMLPSRVPVFFNSVLHLRPYEEPN